MSSSMRTTPWSVTLGAILVLILGIGLVAGLFVDRNTFRSKTDSYISQVALDDQDFDPNDYTKTADWIFRVFDKMALLDEGKKYDLWKEAKKELENKLKPLVGAPVQWKLVLQAVRSEHGPFSRHILTFRLLTRPQVNDIEGDGSKLLQAAQMGESRFYAVSLHFDRGSRQMLITTDKEELDVVRNLSKGDTVTVKGVLRNAVFSDPGLSKVYWVQLHFDNVKITK